MREAASIEQFERRLVELGCPTLTLQAKVCELADHHQDLKQEALDEGLPEGAADARAEAQLGDSILLAENTVAVLRQSSWWGRHPLLGFCLLPPLAFIPAWLFCGGVFGGVWWLLGRVLGPAYSIDENAVRALTGAPAVFGGLARSVNTALMSSSLLLTTLFFCRLARRSASGMKWLLIACVICFLNALCCYVDINLGEHSSLGISYGWPPRHWMYACIPLLAATHAFLRHRIVKNCLAPIPASRRWCAQQAGAGQIHLGRSIYRTPTFWIASVFAVIILAGSVGAAFLSTQMKSKNLRLKTIVWPAERAAALQQLRVRQSAAVSSNQVMINLKPWINASLLDSTGTSSEARDNNLAELPAGVHNFGGVSFDVEGRVQLMGQNLIKAGVRFPGRIKSIPIGRKAGRIYLLHGASSAKTPGQKIARVVLHYQDGTQAEIGITSGRDVLDWWGPIYNTDGGPGRHPASPETELAWVGGNPWIKQKAPDFSLRLYKSALANPHPDLKILSVDYISTLTEAAPFLLGLTIE